MPQFSTFDYMYFVVLDRIFTYILPIKFVLILAPPPKKNPPPTKKKLNKQLINMFNKCKIYIYINSVVENEEYIYESYIYIYISLDIGV